VFGAELRFYRTRASLSQKDLAAKANVSHDVISKIETRERPPAEDFPPRLDAIPELDTRGALTRLWDHLALPGARTKRRSQTLGIPPRASKLTAVTPARRNLTTERAYVTTPVQVTAQPCPFGRVPPSRLR
jgi:transcriptional regulator with XRE-family HTH domain